MEYALCNALKHCLNGLKSVRRGMYWIKVQRSFLSKFWEVVFVGRNGKCVMRSKRMKRRMDAVRLARKIRFAFISTRGLVQIKTEGGNICGKRKLFAG